METLGSDLSVQTNLLSMISISLFCRYSYDNMDDWEKLNETSLAEKIILTILTILLMQMSFT